MAAHTDTTAHRTKQFEIISRYCSLCLPGLRSAPLLNRQLVAFGTTTTLKLTHLVVQLCGMMQADAAYVQASSAGRAFVELSAHEPRSGCCCQLQETILYGTFALSNTASNSSSFVLHWAAVLVV